jgi:methanol metabolism-related c-type cytochrome
VLWRERFDFRRVETVEIQSKERTVKERLLAAALAILALAAGAGVASADGSGDPKPVKDENGKYFDKAGNPTYKVQGDSVDWYTYSGYRRYHSECHVCHGPDGEGSTYAPALKDSLKTMSYSGFTTVVIGGRKNVGTASENVMPAFGTNPNVMCYLDDLYVYLRARANDAWGRSRPPNHEDKPQAATQAENNCMGTK